MSFLRCAANDASPIFVGDVIVSTCVEELLAELGSVWSAVTFAVFDAMPGAPASVTIVIVAVPVFTIVPSKQLTVPSASEHVPAVVLTERYVTFAGNASVTVTLVALAGPLLVTARL